MSFKSACCTFYLCFLLIGGADLSQSVEIYQWKDASGIIHFSDNLYSVPEQYRKKSVRSVGALPAYGRQKPVIAKAALDGASLWQKMCASCHFAGGGKDGDKVALEKVLIDQVSKFPASLERVVAAFQFAAEGRYSDMGRVDISKDELRAIARHLLSSRQKQ